MGPWVGGRLRRAEATHYWVRGHTHMHLGWPPHTTGLLPRLHNPMHPVVCVVTPRRAEGAGVDWASRGAVLTRARGWRGVCRGGWAGVGGGG